LADRVAARAAFFSWTANDLGGTFDAQYMSERLRLGALYDSGDFVTAYQRAQALATRYPNIAMAQLDLAVYTGFASYRIPLPASALDAALAAEARARQLAPSSGEIYIARPLLMPRHLYAQREAWLRRGLEIDAQAPSVSTFLAGILIKAGRFRDATQLLDDAVAREPLNPHKASSLLFVALAQGNNEKAEALQAVEHRYFPNHPQLFAARFDSLPLTGPHSSATLLASSIGESMIEDDRHGPIHIVFHAARRGTRKSELRGR
jgi:hypothetical protein